MSVPFSVSSNQRDLIQILRAELVTVTYPGLHPLLNSLSRPLTSFRTCESIFCLYFHPSGSPSLPWTMIHSTPYCIGSSVQYVLIALVLAVRIQIGSQTQGDAWFKPSEENIAAGVCLRVEPGYFRVFPYENPYLAPFEAAVRGLNPLVAVKVRSAAVHSALATV